MPGTEDSAPVSPETEDEESREARAEHVADRGPTSDEEEAADESRERFAGDADRVADNARSMAERGAKVKGEGQIS